MQSWKSFCCLRFIIGKEGRKRREGVYVGACYILSTSAARRILHSFARDVHGRPSIALVFIFEDVKGKIWLSAGRGIGRSILWWFNSTAWYIINPRLVLNCITGTMHRDLKSLQWKDSMAVTWRYTLLQETHRFKFVFLCKLDYTKPQHLMLKWGSNTIISIDMTTGCRVEFRITVTTITQSRYHSHLILVWAGLPSAT